MKRLSTIAACLAAMGFHLISASPGWAASELLVRKTIGFHACRAAVDNTLTRLKAEAGNIRAEVDTAAMYRIKLVSNHANLVFLCNRVAGQISIMRTTPGELQVMRQ